MHHDLSTTAKVVLAAAPFEPNLNVVNDDDGPRPRTPESPTAMNGADPARNFTLTVDERIRALTIGVPSWAARKKKIEDDEVRFVAELVELHDTLTEKKRAPAQIDEAVAAAANGIDLKKVNDLVRAHNRFYPIEANLPMNLQGQYLVYGRVWKPEQPFTAERLLAKAREQIEQRRFADDE